MKKLTVILFFVSLVLQQMLWEVCGFLMFILSEKGGLPQIMIQCGMQIEEIN